MSAADRRWLLEQILGSAELLGYALPPHAANLLADDLAGYPREVIAKTMARVRAEHRGKLTPSAILDRIDEVAGRPSASEAWAMAVNSLDERKTVVWTVEMQDAWGVVAELARRDLIGARKAFMEAYERLVRIARDERSLPQVLVSPGWDKEHVAVAVQKAIELGYLLPERHGDELVRIGYESSDAPPPQTALQLEYRDGPDKPPVKVGGHSPAAQVVSRGFHPAIAERLAAAREALVAKPEQERLSREQKEREHQQELQARKAEAQRKVDAYKAGKP